MEAEPEDIPAATYRTDEEETRVFRDDLVFESFLGDKRVEDDDVDVLWFGCKYTNEERRLSQPTCGVLAFPFR